MPKIIKDTNVPMVPVNHEPVLLKKVFIEKGLLPGLLQLASVSFNKGECIERHCHESMAEVFYVNFGCLELECDGVIYLLGKSDTFIIFPLEMHSIKILDKSELIYMGIQYNV